MERLQDQADLDAGFAALCAQVPRFGRVEGPLALRARGDGFGALLRAIVSQQVSVASADAIEGRLRAAGLDAPAPILDAPDEALRAAGLSRQKITYLRALAQANLDYAALREAPTETVIAQLTAIKGIGRWSAEIYALFALGHRDVLPAGDLALQEAARALFDLPDRPNERALRDLAQDWAPWRAVAARALWVYYRQVKSREGV